MSRLFLPVFYGSYRRDRKGIRLAEYAVAGLEKAGHETGLVDARAVGLPMLDRMYKEYKSGEAPEAMERVAEILRRADGFVFVAGEYNWGVQPGLKNLTDHFLEEWFHRPAAILSYSMGRTGGARAASAWHATLTEMGMAVVPATVTLGQIHKVIDEDGSVSDDGAGKALASGFAKTEATLAFWAHGMRERRAGNALPY